MLNFAGSKPTWFGHSVRVRMRVKVKLRVRVMTRVHVSTW